MLCIVETMALAQTHEVLLPAGSGAVNVQDYGAQGDGVTDDTAAIRAAMKAAMGYDVRGKTVYFPAGTYLVSDTLWWAEDGSPAAQVTATVDTARGCVTGFVVSDGGHRYRAGWQGGPGVLLSGGGGSGASAKAYRAGDSVAGISAVGGCTGRGYRSAPSVRVVNWRSWLRFQGQSQAGTVIRLKDNAPGFTDANCNVSIGEKQPRENCRAVLYTASQKESNPYGSGESAYETDVWDMTIDTGRGNAGATALDWIGSNRASIRDVTLRSGDGSGRCGLNISRSFEGSGGGPGYIKNLTVNGFDYGVRSGDTTEVGYTLEHISLTGQNVFGLLNQNLSLWIRDLRSTNSVPAVVNRDSGNVVILDAALDGGSASESAILNQGSQRAGQLYVRNVNAAGYQSAIRSGTGIGNTAGAVRAGAYVGEYTSHPVRQLFASAASSLNLMAKETPAEYVDNDFAHWAIVTGYGAAPNDNSDDTAGIQAALDSGKPIVFLPAGQYKISRTLRIPAGVRKLAGLNAQFTTWSGTRGNYPALSCEAGSGGTVEIRNLNFNKDTLGYPAIVNSCTVPLVLADLFDVNGYASEPGSGDVYMENVAIANTLTQRGGNLWARQLDVETEHLHIDADGVQVWVLGLKTEGKSTVLYAHNGAQTEVLGAFHSLHTVVAGPAYQVENSGFSIAGMAAYSTYLTVIQETRAGAVRTYANDTTWTGGTGFALFTAY
jgi:hypothetical protein